MNKQIPSGGFGFRHSFRTIRGGATLGCVLMLAVLAVTQAQAHNKPASTTNRMVIEAFILFTTAAPPPAPQLQRGKQRLDAVLKMTGRDSFVSLSSGIAFFNASGAELNRGCARSVGERLW